MVACAITVSGGLWAKWHMPVICHLAKRSRIIKDNIVYIVEASLGYTRPCLKRQARKRRVLHYSVSPQRT